jgi:hypothetical protein
MWVMKATSVAGMLAVPAKSMPTDHFLSRVELTGWPLSLEGVVSTDWAKAHAANDTNIVSTKKFFFTCDIFLVIKYMSRT